MKKDFRIARGRRTLVRKGQRKRASAEPAVAKATPNRGPTTRKTIEVPEDYFFQVKMRALERRMKEKELWAEIIFEYFENHPSLRRS